MIRFRFSPDASFHNRRYIAIAAGGAWLVSLWLASAASAQTNPGESGGPAARGPQIPIVLGQVPTIRISSLGQVDGGGIAGPCPPTVASHTDANFSGGSFVVQAGFAEGEWLATTYTLPASAFPIKIELIEAIFATSGATQNTTTHWSVGVWDGTPQTGTQVALFSSDDELLPHLRLGIGTTGANLQFLVDPNDPEQIFVTNSNGTNSFSVGYRIDQHHQQTQNPCLVAPPNCCNAFPTTDVSGLQQPANNWLFGVNCGPFGCPANGGWSRFSTLPSFCRPSGDWVMRATWSSVNCVPATGSCCFPNGSCQVLTSGECGTAGGNYQGDGTNCATTNCPQPTGACCFQATGGCLNLSLANCGAAGGVFQGNGTTCATTVCFPRGACCLPDGSCVGPVSPEDCTASNGVFQGNNTNCGTIDCPDPVGSCCFSTGFCLVLSQADCALAGATWGGIGTNCDDANQNGTADQCETPTCPGDRGDGNCDGGVDFFDIDPFLMSLFQPAQYAATYCGGSICAVDIDCSGAVDFFDIDPFLGCLFSTCPNCP